MIPLIEQHRGEIADLCKRYGVKRLELFGSAAREKDFETNSDLDFFIEFLREHPLGIFDRWFGIQEDLGTLFSRRVDLVDTASVTNPYFIAMANEHRITLYAVSEIIQKKLPILHQELTRLLDEP
jgi:predicted nucleotidyltransferase